MNKYSCTINSITELNSTTRKLLINLPDGKALEFKAGQYLNIILPSGKKCPFSIASPPAMTDQIELHVRPTPGSGDSDQITALLQDSETICIEAPQGDCFLDQQPDNPLILMAAATGITQMKSILEHLLVRELVHPIHLYWGVLIDEDLYMDEELTDWASKYQKFHYIPVVSEPENCPDWQGRTGLVPAAVLEDFTHLSNHTVYISCGPGMVYATLDLLVANGLSKESIHSDIFTVAPRTCS
jgi:CDP-4-dehydro-6-deoxyglucose reductase